MEMRWTIHSPLYVGSASKLRRSRLPCRSPVRSGSSLYPLDTPLPLDAPNRDNAERGRLVEIRAMSSDQSRDGFGRLAEALGCHFRSVWKAFAAGVIYSWTESVGNKKGTLMAEKKAANQQLVVEEKPQSSTEDEIRKRAYELYCARNGGPGDEIGDWLKAENEIKQLHATT
jgi:hypothetical protein